MPNWIWLLPVAILLVLAACAPSDQPTTSETASGPVLSYTNAFVMEPIGGRDMTMGGVEVSVEGGDVRLVSASSPAFEAIELHTMAMADGKMQMRQVDGFDLADGNALTLARGGDHFMMFGVSDTVKSGETVDITLTFDAGGEPLTLVIDAAVKAVGEE